MEASKQSGGKSPEISRVDGPHPAWLGERWADQWSPEVLAGLNLSANVRLMQTQLQQLTERLASQKRQLERRERELAARALAWRQRRYHARHSRSYVLPEQPAGLPGGVGPAWRDRLASASLSGIDLEHCCGPGGNRLDRLRS